jgi:hypothetical protein
MARACCRSVAIVGDSNSLLVWDIAENTELHRISCLRGVRHVAFVAVRDLTKIVYSDDTKHIRVIEFGTWKQVVVVSEGCGAIHNLYEAIPQILLLSKRFIFSR